MRFVIAFLAVVVLAVNVAPVASAGEYLRIVPLSPVSSDGLIVDYDKTREEMIRAGHYSAVDQRISAEFLPSSGRAGVQTVRWRFFRINKTVRAETAIAEMNPFGYRPATIEELLAFGENFFGVSGPLILVALGSIGSTRAGNFFPVFTYDGKGTTTLAIVSPKNGFAISTFLGVAK